MHSGVLKELSDSRFSENGAAHEGPAVLSLGQLAILSKVEFNGNHRICDLGYYSGQGEAVSFRVFLLSHDISVFVMSCRSQRRPQTQFPHG